jgi:PIN domain nuclease of toxin-antitoxin system
VVRVLLDTHPLLWFVLDDDRLSALARSAIIDRSNDLLISPASYWEIAIKVRLGKYTLDEDFAGFWEREIVDNHWTILPITVKHASVVATLPLHHRDPFDRLLIAQAMSEEIPIVSGDRVFDRYDVTRVW